MSQTEARGVLDDLLLRSSTTRTLCGAGDMVWRQWGLSGPDAPVVVLLHGGSGAWNHWVRTIPSLEGEYCVYAGDLPGCGESDGAPEPYDAASLAGIVSQGLDQLIPDGRAFDLVSFSFGGILSGLIAQAQGARVRSVTIVGTPILGLIKTGKANQLVPVPPELSREEAEPLYRANLGNLMISDPAAVDDLALTLHIENMDKARLRSRGIARRFPSAPTFEGLSCQLNFIYGAADPTLFPDLEGVRAHVADAHPGARFHIIPDAGHWVQFEAATRFNRILSELLSL